jgi:hypothetical protein
MSHSVRVMWRFTLKSDVSSLSRVRGRSQSVASTIAPGVGRSSAIDRGFESLRNDTNRRALFRLYIAQGESDSALDLLWQKKKATINQA